MWWSVWQFNYWHIVDTSFILWPQVLLRLLENALRGEDKWSGWKSQDWMHAEWLPGESLRLPYDHQLTCATKTVMSEQIIGQIVSEDVFRRYQNLANKTYVEDNRRGLRFCPGPDCENVIECQVRGSDLESYIPIVLCKCGQVSCFGCSFNGDHRPALCGVTNLWVKKCEDDSETANWISANTKECPRVGILSQ